MSSTMPAPGGTLLKQGPFVFFLLSRSLSRFSSQIAGVATIVTALLWMKLFPTLRDVERLE